MAVHAHPDDGSAKGAGTMAAYAAAGAEVMVVTCTGGEAGTLLNPSFGDTTRADRDIAAVRREEMAEAARILGIRHAWLGFLDSGLPEGDPLPALPANCFAEVPLRDAATPLISLVRRFRPHVLVSYDEVGGYPHPAHLQAHAVTMEAYRAARPGPRGRPRRSTTTAASPRGSSARWPRWPRPTARTCRSPDA